MNLMSVSDLTVGAKVFVPGPNHLIGDYWGDKRHYGATVVALIRQHDAATEVRLTYDAGRGTYGVSLHPEAMVRQNERLGTGVR